MATKIRRFSEKNRNNVQTLNCYGPVDLRRCPGLWPCGPEKVPLAIFKGLKSYRVKVPTVRMPPIPIEHVVILSGINYGTSRHHKSSLKSQKKKKRKEKNLISHDH